MSDCTHSCESCGEDCAERTAPENLRVPCNDMSSIKKVIAVVSGKGGVGKSMVTSMLAVAARREGFDAAVLDADVTGPSIPKAFGLTGLATSSELGILPVETKTGVKVMSVNLLLEHTTDPVVWRGPVISGVVTHFWTDVVWGEVDYLFVDMPPGTGDVPLTVFQSLPVDGIIIVTSPQELVSMIVEKAVNMAELMHVPVLGIVENMSYFECSNCHERHEIFGKSHVEAVAKAHGIERIARLPIDPKLAELSDAGDIEHADPAWLSEVAKLIDL